jgi:phospholipase D1/2
MTSAGPADGDSNPEHLKDKLKHPFSGLLEKFKDTKLHDLKVGLVHKKYSDAKYYLQGFNMLTPIGTRLASLQIW